MWDSGKSRTKNEVVLYINCSKIPNNMKISICM